MRRRSAEFLGHVRQLGKFSTMEELQDYFDDNKIICLLCGKAYFQLAAHIIQAHDISADAYKEQFGIPWTYGLAGKAFRQKASLHMRALMRSGKLPRAPSRAHIKGLIAAAKKRRPLADAVLDKSREKLLALHGRVEKWGPRDFEEYLRRIGLGRTPAEVGQDEDMPGADLFHQYVKQDAAFGKRFRKIWESLPYAVHVRANKLGERFQQDVVKLRRRDMTWPEIAAKLGVSSDAARSTWHELKKRGKLTSRDLEHENRRYKRDDYEEYLRRVASGRTVVDVGRDADMPTAFHAYLRRHPSFRKRYEKILDDLPYELQARRRRRMRKRFQKEVANLRKKGQSWPAIGQALGVHPGTARRAWRRYEKR